MGYYTYRELVVENSEGIDINKDYYAEEIESEYPASFDENSKWYEEDKDMREYSTKYPNLLFLIYGRGEEGEEYRAYYKDGKCYMVVPEVIWPEFNEATLK